MAQQEIKIALCGAGNVGGAVLELLTVNADFYKKMFDTDFLVTDVVTKSGKLRGYKDKFNGNIHADLESIINNNSIDVVIEVMGGIDDAYKVAKQALESKKDFITANKAMISLHGDELFKLAEENNLFIGFEASVAGGIPIIRSLSSKARIENISWFAGILNGTSNYILSNMESDGIELKEGVKQAQELGFAEADPTLDLNGTDAAQKAKVLSSIRFKSFAILSLANAVIFSNSFCFPHAKKILSPISALQFFIISIKDSSLKNLPIGPLALILLSFSNVK